MDSFIVIIIAVLVCCCCLILSSGAYFFTQSSSSKSTASTKSTAPTSASASAPTSAQSRAPTNTDASRREDEDEDEDEDEVPTTTSAPTTPEIKIPKFIIRIGGTNWANLIQNGDESPTNIQTWNPDQQSNNLDAAKVNQIGVQFRYFAEFWLNKTGKSSGSTNVYGSSVNNNLGKYDFSVNGTSYTGSFNGTSWSWNYSGDYCFTTANAQKNNTCMNGWEFQNGACYASGNANGNASTKCSPYGWSGMAGYSEASLNGWVNACSVSNTSNCKN